MGKKKLLYIIIPVVIGIGVLIYFYIKNKSDDEEIKDPHLPPIPPGPNVDEEAEPNPDSQPLEM